MNTVVKQKWVDALRSGEYEQAYSKLFDGSNYCCLGVLCDLYSKEHDEKWEFRHTEYDHQDRWYYYDQSEVLPDVVMNWAGLSKGNPTIVVNEPESGESLNQKIAELNDSGYNFKELSNYIEEQF